MAHSGDTEREGGGGDDEDENKIYAHPHIYTMSNHQDLIKKHSIVGKMWGYDDCTSLKY